MYEANRVEDGVLIYERKKTRTRRSDRAEMKVKVKPEIMCIMEQHKGHDSKYQTMPSHDGVHLCQQIGDRTLVWTILNHRDPKHIARVYT